MKKSILQILFICTITFLVVSCKDKNKKVDADSISDISLRFDWIPTMSFAGDIVAMHKYDSINGLNLELNAAGEGVDPIKMVLSGTDDVGIVGLDKLIMANEKGAELVAIGIVDYVTPTVFMSKKELNISKPEDFYGKKVGVQSGGATEFVYRTLVNKLSLDENKIDEVQIGFDMKPFLDGQYDVRPGFIFDEAVYLDLNSVEYNLIEPIKFGIKYPGRVYFVKKSFLEENPALIQNFINTVSKGWTDALENPKEAIQMLQEFEPKINYDREYNGLVKAKDYFSGYQGKILNPDTEAIQSLVKELQSLGVIEYNPKFEEFFTMEFIQ